MAEFNKDDKYVWLYTGSGVIEILAPLDLVEAVAQSGDNEQAVAELMDNNFVASQVARYSDKVIFSEYEETGLNVDKMSKTRFQCEQALLWSLCWDYVDNEHNDDDIETGEQALRLAFTLGLIQTVVEYDVDCHREYEVLRYKHVGHDTVYMAEYIDEEALKQAIDNEDDIYELTIPTILKEIENGKIKLFWKNNI